MSISNTTGIGSKVDFIYNFKNLNFNQALLKPDISNSHPIDDIVSISDKAKALLEEEQDKKIALNNYTQEEFDLKFKQLKDSTDDSNKFLKIQFQCLQIAMRIISGDNIPSKDREFLAQHEPEMYTRAILLRRTKENPKNHKSLLEDEKTQESADSSFLISHEKSEITHTKTTPTETTQIEDISTDTISSVDEDL